MVRVLIDDDVIAIPEPVAAEADVVGRDAEVEPCQAEAIGPPSEQPEDVAATEAAGEPPVLPWVVEMVMRIVAAGVVADPLVVPMNMRRAGMTRSSPALGRADGCAGAGRGPRAGMCPPPTAPPRRWSCPPLPCAVTGSAE